MNEYKAICLSEKTEWDKKFAQNVNELHSTEVRWRKLCEKTSLQEGKRDLYDRLIKAGDEKTLWTTTAERDPHPEWLRRKEEAVRTEQLIRNEWDSAHKEKAECEEKLNTLRYENQQLKESYEIWMKNTQEKMRILQTQEEMRKISKKQD